jgi:DegV family protein with EDD domain
LGVGVVPVYIIYGTERLRDGVDIDKATFYKRMAAGENAKTEPATVDDYKAIFARTIEGGNDALLISMSSGISPSYENAKAAAALFPGRVYVVDSRGASGLESLFVEYAAERAAAGDSAESISKRLAPGSLKTAIFFAVPDMASFGRSGRLPRAIAALGSVMGVSMVLKMSEQGVVASAGQSFSFEKTCEIMVDALTRAVARSPQVRIAVTHIEAEATAKSLAKMFEEKLGHPPAHEMIRETTVTIATHIGKGAVGIAAIVP